MQVLDSGGVDYDVVHVPQVDVGQIAGQDALDLGVNLLALFLVQRSVTFLKQVVHLGIGVTATIGTLWREAGRVKSVKGTTQRAVNCHVSLVSANSRCCFTKD